jgi:5-methylcytosine-specific restriction endonuclease McrA
MFRTENEPLALLVELTPRLAKKRFRAEIYKAWDHLCGYCGDSATSLDHIIPKFKSGSSNWYNLVPACQRCNNNKASHDMEEWYRAQLYFEEERLEKIQEWMANKSSLFVRHELESLNLLSIKPA